MSLPSGPKAYVRELLPDSQTVQVGQTALFEWRYNQCIDKFDFETINDEFRHVAKDVHLWSFFEGAPTAGVMIVEKVSAIIGMCTNQIDIQLECRPRLLT